MYYELATMTLPFGTASTAATHVQAFANAPEAQGELLACWFTDIGVLNQMIVLRGFATLDDLQAERERTQQSASPFGCGEIFQTLEQHSYKGFPWMKPVRRRARNSPPAWSPWSRSTDHCASPTFGPTPHWTPAPRRAPTQWHRAFGPPKVDQHT